MNEYNQLWPYLLFLPQNPETRDEFVRTILASRLARNVFLSFDKTGRVFQRDLIQNLPHSNKSVLVYLKELAKFELITTNTAIRGGKRVVYHELTNKGKGIASFFLKELPTDLGDLTASLLENYLLRLVILYRDQGMSESAIFDVFTRTRGLAILERSERYSEPDVIIFGASAFYTMIDCDQIPVSGGITSCNMPSRFPGGPSVELAFALAEVGYKVTFVSSVGNDQDGYNLISNLVQHKVDVTNFIVEDKLRTNETLIINDRMGSRYLIGYGGSSALTISSPKQVPWKVLEQSKLVYIGEVFVEAALSIVTEAKSLAIPIIYQPSVPFLERGLDTLESIFRHIDLLILSNRAWNYLKKNTKGNVMDILRNITDASIIARETKENYLLLTKSGKEHVISCKNHTEDISQWFLVGVFQGIIMGLMITDAFRKGANLENLKF